MRPVKLLNDDLKFLADGSAFDLSIRGARVIYNGPPSVSEELYVLDEVEATIRRAALVWTRGRQVGLRYVATARQASHAEMIELTGRYYALVD